MIRFTSIATIVLFTNNCATPVYEEASGELNEVSIAENTEQANLLAELAQSFGLNPNVVEIQEKSTIIAVSDIDTHPELLADSFKSKIRNLTENETGTSGILASLQETPNNGGWSQRGDRLYHEYSGMECATSHTMILSDETTGEKSEFTVPLTEIKVYDAEGYDTHCHYQDDSESRYFTFYASYWPYVTLDQSAGGAYQLILDRYDIKEEAPLIYLTRDDDDKSTSTIEGANKSAAFLVNMPDKPEMKTALWINKTGGWHVKARATYVNGDMKSELLGAVIFLETLNRIDTFINKNEDLAVSNDFPV